MNLKHLLLVLLALSVTVTAKLNNKKKRSVKVVAYGNVYHKICEMANEATDEMTLCDYHAPDCCKDCEKKPHHSDS